MKKIIFAFFTLFSLSFSNEIILKKELTYNKYTLDNFYKYKNTSREFQWEKIENKISNLEKFQNEYSKIGTLRNFRNSNGNPPKLESFLKSPERDKYGVRREQGIPLYESLDRKPVRYAWDGSLVGILEEKDGFVKIKIESLDGEWWTLKKYVKEISTDPANKLIFIDRKNQNIATLQKENGIWLIRSMNPATTGLDKLPHNFPTPLGTFVVQNKKPRMNYLKLGSSSEIAGFAPYATRFSGGGYIHGIPVELPKTQIIEHSPTLGSTPRSRMCVRNASSHAKYIYEWARPLNTLVVVIE
ncbi:L,D-transpeptidase [Cetobacterium somerae]|uniref:L,D-transpeptidase n=1 Tax=Cetobacterium somerae TaxID=188913 RepID=UPI003D7694FC